MSGTFSENDNVFKTATYYDKSAQGCRLLSFRRHHQPLMNHIQEAKHFRTGGRLDWTTFLENRLTNLSSSTVNFDRDLIGAELNKN